MFCVLLHDFAATIRSLYEHSDSCVLALGVSVSPVDAGLLWLPSVSAPVLGFHGWDPEVQPRPGARPTQEPLRIMCLLYAEDLVLLASPVDDLQHTECKAAGVKTSTLKPASSLFSARKRWLNTGAVLERHGEERAQTI